MKIAIIYYSTYGHVVTMAQAVKEGVESSQTGAQVDILQVPETLSTEVLDKLHAAPKQTYPVATVDTLATYDAFIFGYPTRFGTVPAQMSSFLDQTGGLWASGALHGKPVGLFTSTSSPGGGQEMTLRNFISYIAHHGLVYIPLGYGNAFGEITNLSEVHGGTPYGASTFAGADGSRQPTDLEKKIAFIQGEAFAKAALKFVKDAPAFVPVSEKKTETPTQEVTTTAEKRVAQQSAPAKEKELGCGVKCVIM